MILLFDVGNTNSHLGLADLQRIRKHADIPTSAWRDGSAPGRVVKFIGGRPITGAILSSVVPSVTPAIKTFVKKRLTLACAELNFKSIRGVGLDYPRPSTIGADRLANAIAIVHHYGAPAVVVDFGTAVTFDVIDRHRNYIGGIIAPGLSAMTDYLHEHTALLPKIKIRETSAIVGKNTEQAMLIGAVHGYRGLIRELLLQLTRKLKCQQLPVVATGGYARLMASKMPEITAVNSLLTLEGLRLAHPSIALES